MDFYFRKIKPLDLIDKIELSLSLVLKLSILLLAIISVWRMNIFLVFSSLVVLFFMSLPSMIERNYRINLPTEFDFVITLILWLHFVLGEVDKFYEKIPWWDLFLHYTSGYLLGLFAFILVYVLFYTHRIEAKPWFYALFIISFALALGAVWELFEFMMDNIFGFNMQKSGLVDTMTDLMVDLLGAAVMAIIGYFYLKKPRSGFTDRILRKIMVNIKRK